MTVMALSEDLWASASGRLALQGSARSYRLRGVRGRFVARGETVTLELRLPPHALTAARRALRSLRDVTARVELSARDAAGNMATRKRTVELER